MKVLDLHCKQGGAAAGYVRAGHQVHGWDIEPQPRYLASGAESFTQGDATTADLGGYDLVHTSPPCQDLSDTMGFGLKSRGTGWQLPFMIERLRSNGSMFVVENVVSAQTRKIMQPQDGETLIMLCGSAFDLGAPDSRGQWRSLARHRLFLLNWNPGTVPGCACAGKQIGGVYGHGEQGVNGGRGYGFAADSARLALQTPWMNRGGCAEAIPPAFTEYIGRTASYLQ